MAAVERPVSRAMAVAIVAIWSAVAQVLWVLQLGVDVIISLQPKPLAAAAYGPFWHEMKFVRVPRPVSSVAVSAKHVGPQVMIVEAEGA